MARTTKILGIETGPPDKLWRLLRKDRGLSERGLNLFGALNLDDEVFFNVEVYRNFYMEWGDPSRDPLLVAVRYTPQYNAALMWESNWPGSLKWFLEAYALADVPLEEMVRKFGGAVDELSIKAYERMFFDVRGKLDNSAWVNSFIVAPATRVRDPGRFYYDCVHKLVALKCGVEGLNALVDYRPLNDKTRDELFNRVMSDYRNREVLKNVSAYDKLDYEGIVAAQEREVDRWRETKTALGDASDVGECMRKLADAVSTSMRLRSPEETCGEVERLDDVEKYSEKDL